MEELHSHGDEGAGGGALARLRSALRQSVGEDRFTLWLGPPTQIRMHVDRVVVECPSAAHRQWIDRNLRGALSSCVATVLGEQAHLQLAVASREASSDVGDSEAQSVPCAATPATTTQSTLQRKRQKQQPLRQPFVGATDVESGVWRQQQRWSFGAFEAGSANRLAVEAARETARSPGRYTPLVLYGPVGCGKTHLLHAIALEMRKARTAQRVLHVTAEQFTTQFLDALQQRQSPGFRHKFRSIDALLVDDVEFLAGKQATLAEFLATLDALHQRGGQAVLTCADGPLQLQLLSPDLASRAAAGLSVALELPEFEARLAIARQIAARCRLELASGVTELLAQRVVGSARLLAGALNRLAAVSMASRRSIDLTLAEEAVDAYCREHAPQVRLNDIQRAVCDVFGVEPQSLKSARRTQAAAGPRMLAMWLARKYTRAALSEIGDFFGRRSHSTVVSAQRKVDRLISQKSEIVVADRPCRIEDALHRLEAALRVG